ncbi:AraC family transcriptional regulator ligand-binding domain-containing protein [Acinetobacter bereziniae]|uniref:AraC family transcriptional regulator n=1 Tax=Acinetobacter bereziniae TaxID=106648 RepID=UPI003214F579
MGSQQKESANSQFYIPPMILTSLIHYGEQQHWQYADWFKLHNLDLEQIRQGQGFVAFSELCGVIQDALNCTQQKHLGLLLGSHEGQISIGILGFAMQACKTVAEALETALQYHPISGSVLDLSVHLSQDYCEIELIERSDCGPLKAFFCDEVFASIMTCLNMMLDRDYELISLELSYDHSAYSQDYQRIFQCPILFKSNRNLIRFPNTLLAKTLKNHSPVNYQIAIQMCQQALNQFNQINQHSIVQVLQHLIESHLPERFDMHQAAQHFHLSERHLRRLLLNDGLSFQHLKQQVLEKKAKQWLEDNQSISQISFNLGFSELREFRRAFKKWTGFSPSEYKKTKLLSSVS